MAQADFAQINKAPMLGPLSLEALNTINKRRLTIDSPARQYGKQYAQHENPTQSWKTLEVQRKYLLNLPISRLTQIALDLSPQVGKGLFDFLRFCNPGWMIETESDTARAIVNDFMKRLTHLHGSFDVLIDRMFASIFIGGAYFLELVLNEAGTEALNIAVLDPILARFVRQEEPGLGQYWQLTQRGQTGTADIVLQDEPRVKYVGIDTLPDSPYGRPMVTPSVYASIFLLGLIQDIRRVIANQGYNRLDYSVNTEELLKLAAAENKTDKDIAKFIASHITQIRGMIESLEIDTSYVHLDTVEVNYADSGTPGTLPGLDILVRTLERQITNGLKSIPILMGSNESVAETHANRQLDFYIASIESIQDELAAILNDFFQIVLQIQGIQDPLKFFFRRQRIIDRKTIAETEMIVIDNIIKKVNAQLITQEQAIDEASSLADPLQLL